MEKERVDYLIKRYAGNNLTRIEESELLAILAAPGNEEIRKRVIDHCVDHIGATAELSEESSDEILRSILSKREKTSTGRVVFLQGRMKYAAAVALIIVSTTAAWLYFGDIFNKGGKQAPVLAEETVSIPAAVDIEPGGNVATLILADGSKVLLEESHEGLIEQQGNMKIIKTDNTQIVYTVDEAPSVEEETGSNTIITPRGGQYKVILPDGSAVWLNSSSSITFPVVFAKGSRRVEVTGEAYFDVKTDVNRPFLAVIRSGSKLIDDIEVEVTGTEFNVMAYSDEKVIYTTLIEGKVKVGKLNDSGSAKVLQPGQQARLSDTGSFSVVKANVEEVAAWKNGYFLFNNEDITSIMRQVARWYDVDVHYEGEFKYRSFSANVSRFENVTELLQKFEMTGVIKFKVEGKRITVTP